MSAGGSSLRRAFPCAWRAAGILLVVLLLVPHPTARAEDPLSPEQLRERSLPLRTALHHDPTLASPLERLLDLYRKADRVEELTAVYRGHVQQYPQDRSARTVYVRLLMATSDPEAAREVRSAVEQHPTYGYLHYLLFTLLDDRGDARALDALDAAIAHATLQVRKRRWVEQLLGQALEEDRRELAAKHIAGLAALMGGGAQAHLEAARTMQAFGFHAQALSQLERGLALTPAPEAGVAMDLLAASLEVALGKRREAAARLDRLLGRVTADYWRRFEILRRRARLVASEAERDGMLAAARERAAKSPDDESAALDLARLLSGFERHREALAGLRAAGTRLPASGAIEKEILTVFDRLRDENGRAAYLEKRLAAYPTRQDLLELSVRTLFLLGRRAPALALLERLLEPLAAPVRLQRLLETARFLRGVARHGTAATLYERVVAIDPARLDVRREWAECHLVQGDRAGARRVLAAPIPTDTPKDVFLDLVQLLAGQRLYTEARAALQTRLAAQPDDLEIHLALIDVEGGLGYATSAASLIASARPLADTPARYRRWLEEAVSFHRLYDDEEAFLAREQQRFEHETGAWTGARAGRVEAFAEVCSAAQRVDPVAALLQDWLAGSLPDAIRVRLRRRLAAMLEESGRGWFTRNKAHLGVAAAELERLLDDDPASAHEYRARLALIHIARKRADLARPLLEQVDVRRLVDPGMLERLVRAYRDLGDGPRVLDCLERLTTVAPAERGAWEDWLAALTASGNESKLRGAIRRLLRGVPRMALSEATRARLAAHLGDSYWRSIGREVETHVEAGYLEALALLDQAERITSSEDAPLWVAWTRAYLFNALRRDAARDEAIGELDRMMGERRAAGVAAWENDRDPPDPDPESAQAELAKEALLESIERLHFPDGIGATWSSARALLRRTAAPKVAGRPRADRRGPAGGLRARWIFEPETDVPVITVLALDARTLLVADAAGDLYGVQRRTGKLLWHHPRAFTANVAGAQSPAGWLAPTNRPVACPGGRACASSVGRLDCYDASGDRRWGAALGVRAAGSTPLLVAADERAVYACDSASGEVGAFHPDTGKLLWHRTLELDTQSPPLPQGDGLALQGDRLLVYGPRSAVLDARSGAVLWTFEPGRARRMPVTLDEPDEATRGLFGRRRRRPARRTAAAPVPVPSSPPALFGRPSIRRWAGPTAYGVGYGPAGMIPSAPILLTRSGRSPAAWAPNVNPGRTTAVVAPAARWAAPLGSAETRLGLLLGSRLVLMRGIAAQPAAQAGMESLLLDLDLPLFAQSTRIAGTPVAVYGERVALLQPGRLVVWHLGRGTQTVFPLEDIAGEHAPHYVDVAQDGGFLYLGGPGGIVCVHISTLRRVFTAAWPKGVRRSDADVPTSVLCLPRGIAMFHNPGGWRPMRLPVGLVDQKTLYLLADPSRLVALEGAPPSGAAGAHGGKR